MKRFRQLFEQYRRGYLDENGIEEMHQSLIGTYFGSPMELAAEEFEYTEDLIIQNYTLGILDGNYALQFKDALAANKNLNRKYRLLSDLDHANEKEKSKQISLQLKQAETAVANDEEEQLTKVLEEVIAKIREEKEGIASAAQSESLLTRVKTWVEGLVSALSTMQPQYRVAIAFASVLFIAFAVWVSVKTGEPELISENPDSISNNPVIKTDTARENENKDKIQLSIPQEIQKPLYASADSAADLNKRGDHFAHRQKEIDKPEAPNAEADELLLACAENIPSSMDYLELRSESSLGNDLFIDAAKKFGNREYDSCIKIMNGIIRNREIRSPDSLSEINHYLGLSYLAKGFRGSNHKQLSLSLRAFGHVDPNSSFYNDSRWYSALVEIRMGQTAKGLHILDSLLRINYGRTGEVRTLRDKIAGTSNN